LSGERESHKNEEDTFIGYGGRVEQLSFLDQSGEIPVRIERNRMNIFRTIREHAAQACELRCEEHRDS
jgi:hypothetical protein